MRKVLQRLQQAWEDREEWLLYLFIFGVFFVITIVGCITSGCRGDGFPEEFTTIKRCGNYDIIAHNQTGVMYAVSDSANNRGTLSVLVDADGRPLIYNSSED